MTGRLPDFIIGGAPRSGTTWLYTLLDRHPGVFMAKPVAPEPKFFLVDDSYEKGLAHYSALFASAAPGQIAGEKSTNYLESATAAYRMHRHLPRVRLIFMLRDPVERAYSNYLWSRMNGLENETFAEALILEEFRERHTSAPLRYARPHAYFSRGLYADLLTPYFELFSPEQILCLRYEDIQEAPQGLVQNVHHFLGIPPHPDDVVALGRINAVKSTEPGMPQEIRKSLRQAYTDPNRRLAALLGNGFSIWDYGEWPT